MTHAESEYPRAAHESKYAPHRSRSTPRGVCNHHIDCARHCGSEATSPNASIMARRDAISARQSPPKAIEIERSVTTLHGRGRPAAYATVPSAVSKTHSGRSDPSQHGQRDTTTIPFASTWKRMRPTGALHHSGLRTPQKRAGCLSRPSG